MQHFQKRLLPCLCHYLRCPLIYKSGCSHVCRTVITGSRTGREHVPEIFDDTVIIFVYIVRCQREPRQGIMLTSADMPEQVSVASSVFPSPAVQPLQGSAEGRRGRTVPYELLEIKDTRLPIELFERLLAASRFESLDRTLYFINPHYEVKFGLRPRRLARFISAIPYLRDFFTTSAFYILKLK